MLPVGRNLFNTGSVSVAKKSPADISKLGTRVSAQDSKSSSTILGKMSQLLQKMGLSLKSQSNSGSSIIPTETYKLVSAQESSQESKGTVSMFSPKAGAVNVGSKTRTVQGDAKEIRNNQLDVYLKALNTLKGREDIRGDSAKCVLIDRKIANVQDDKSKPIEAQTSGGAMQEALVNKEDLAGTTTAIKTLLKELGVPGDAKKMLLSARKELLNKDQQWVTKEGVIGKETPNEVTSTITPANNSVKGSVTSDTMTARGTTGTTCQSNLEVTDKAANLQMTSLSRGGKTIFSAIRHAIVSTKIHDPSEVKVSINGKEKPLSELSKDELKGILKKTPFASDSIAGKLEKKIDSGKADDLKTVHKALASRIANQNKAVDILRTAIVQKLSENAEISKDKDGVMTINLTSVSLVTPHGVKPLPGHEEKKMLADQTQALNLLSKLSTEEKTELLKDIKVGGQSLADMGVKDIAVSTSTFNFGVNAGEMLGRTTQASQNKEAMKNLKAQVQTRRESLEAQVKESPGSDAAKQLKLLNALEKKVDEKFQPKLFKMHYTLSSFTEALKAKLPISKANPYEVPVLIAALNRESGGSLAFNCMSGKDRTGMMDVLSKIFMTHLDKAMKSGDEHAISNSANYFERMVDDQSFRTEQQPFNKEMLFQSGNREVQQENTTGWGYKLDGGNNKQMFTTMFGISHEEVHGFSKNFGA